LQFTVIFKRGASLDMQDAFEYYKNIDSALANSFVNEVEKTITGIQSNPQAFQKRYGKVRIVFTKRFPYGVHYTTHEQTIFIHAVFHTSRKPKE